MKEFFRWPEQVLTPDGFDEEGDYQRWMVHCPTCREFNLDRDCSMGNGDHGAVYLEPDEPYATGLSPIGTRGGHVRVDLYCCNGHTFSIVVANHKGSEYIGVIRTGSDFA